jgi:hypothetical protein
VRPAWEGGCLGSVTRLLAIVKGLILHRLWHAWNGASVHNGHGHEHGVSSPCQCALGTLHLKVTRLTGKLILEALLFIHFLCIAPIPPAFA